MGRVRKGRECRQCTVLTRVSWLLVEENLEGVLLLPLERRREASERLLARVFARHERTGARPLHHFRARVAGELTEGVVAVDDGVVEDVGVCEKEAAVGCNQTKA